MVKPKRSLAAKADSLRQEVYRKQQEYADNQYKANERAATEFNKRKDVVMSSLHSIASPNTFTGADVKQAAEEQRQKDIEQWHNIRNAYDAAATVGEQGAAGYGLYRGLTHLQRAAARRATQSAGQPVSREAMKHLAEMNKKVAKIDKGQAAANAVGGIVDGYQWASADNKFDATENAIETGANALGFVGGMNWFKNLPILRAIGGDKIDNILDAIGYSAAGWDVVKYFPPISTVLNNLRESTNKRNLETAGKKD